MNPALIRGLCLCICFRGYEQTKFLEEARFAMKTKVAVNT